MYICTHISYSIQCNQLYINCPVIILSQSLFVAPLHNSHLHHLCLSDSLSSLRSTSDSQERMAPKDIMTNSHAKSILNAMNSLRKSNTLCDITLRVESTDFPAHRIVLAACSDYFCAMFTSEVTESCTPKKIYFQKLE